MLSWIEACEEVAALAQLSGSPEAVDIAFPFADAVSDLLRSVEHSTTTGSVEAFNKLAGCYLSYWDTLDLTDDARDESFRRATLPVRTDMAALQFEPNLERVESWVAEFERRPNVSYLDRSTSRYDAFVSYASEDRSEVVSPLVDALEALGLVIWYDQTALEVGDSLRRSLDEGLRRSRFAIVILSDAFFAKKWTLYELDGILEAEAPDRKVLLPIWHTVDQHRVSGFSRSIAGRIALSTREMSIPEIARALATTMQRAD